MSARATVVIPTRDRAERLRACLAAVAEQLVDGVDVVVVDDASTDHTPSVIGAAGPRIRGIRLDRPLGPAGARNAALSETDSDVVVFTDDDCVPQPGWLAQLLEAHQRDPEAIVQGRTDIDPRERERLGAFGRSQAVTSGPGPWFQTCNIAYPRALLERLAGFDEAFAATGEDTDLAWRAIEAGTRIVFEPSALVWHGVHEPGALALVRGSQRWRFAVRNVKRHPELRAALHRGVFWKPSHERLLVAAAGVLAARRMPALAVAAVIPYLMLHRSAHGSAVGTAAALPAHVAVDGAEVVAMLRGSAAARTIVL